MTEIEVQIKIGKQIESRIKEIYNRQGMVETPIIRKILNRHIRILGERNIENMFLNLFTKYGSNYVSGKEGRVWDGNVEAFYR